MRICFLNPFGTPDYDAIITRTLAPSLRPGTDVEVRHLEDSPRNIDYYVPKHLVEVEVLKAVLAAEREGFDAFVIGCCYDPALTQARELVSIPVIGPLEASVLLARPFGHRFSVLTDHLKAVPEICRSVRAIDWYVDDMIGDPASVARDVYARSAEILASDRSEVIVLGCTIVAACYEQTVLSGHDELADLAIVNPNLMAVKLAELFADLNLAGQYRISRSGYYQQHGQHDQAEAAQIRALLDGKAGQERASE